MTTRDCTSREHFCLEWIFFVVALHTFNENKRGSLIPRCWRSAVGSPDASPGWSPARPQITAPGLTADSTLESAFVGPLSSLQHGRKCGSGRHDRQGAGNASLVSVDSLPKFPGPLGGKTKNYSCGFGQACVVTEEKGGVFYLLFSF